LVYNIIENKDITKAAGRKNERMVHTMTYTDISCMTLINEIDTDKRDALVASMLKDGWVGCPILVNGDTLLTGSHRLAALHCINDMVTSGEIDDAPVLYAEVAADVSEIVDERYSRFAEENGYERDIDYSDIGWLLEGSWVEEYKDEIIEW